MYKEERLIGTLSLIEQKRVVTIEDLANELYISPSTVRRDLAELAKRGLIARTSGGAVAVTEMKKNDLMGEISGILPVENALGARAENLIPQKSTIFLSASLPLSMVPPLENRPNLRVVTDSAQIANSLCGKGVQIFCTSGTYLAAQDSFTGRLAAEFASKFQYDLVFLSCDALTPQKMLTYYDFNTMQVIDAAKHCAQKMVLLCDNTQVDKYAGCSVLALKEIDIVVTNVPEYFQDFTGIVIDTGTPIAN